MKFAATCGRFQMTKKGGAIMDKKKYDAAYISYVESGESAAVFVVRDIVRSIDTTGMWIDVLSLKGSKNKDGRWDFEYINVELFPRKHHPKYPAGASEEDKKYITWKTANEDITEQRIHGFEGSKFKVHLKLVNRNKGRCRKVKAAWNITFGQWVPDEWFGSSCEWREKKVPYKPKWDYAILAIKRL